MIEYEVKIPKVDIEDITGRLERAGAQLTKPRVTQRIIVFRLPRGREIEGGWLRVRDEGDKITMSLKSIPSDRIEEQLELCFVADSMEEAAEFLEMMGAEEKARQEKRRETWTLGGCEVTIDEWPFIEPIIEVEGKSEEEVMRTVELLGFTPEDCRVCAMDALFSEKYGLEPDIINNHTPIISFDGPNPFLGK